MTAPFAGAPRPPETPYSRQRQAAAAGAQKPLPHCGCPNSCVRIKEWPFIKTGVPRRLIALAVRAPHKPQKHTKTGPPKGGPVLFSLLLSNLPLRRFAAAKAGRLRYDRAEVGGRMRISSKG